MCDGRIDFADPRWSCACGFCRPDAYAEATLDSLDLTDGRRTSLEGILPGRFNRSNAAVAAIAAEVLGHDINDSIAAIRSISEVAGRFAKANVGGSPTRLLLAKNPAGWAELIGLVENDPTPAVIAINSRDADGHDTSWLWDVPFDRLGSRLVVASGERRRDLAVRLRHARIDYRVGPERPIDAVTLLARSLFDATSPSTSRPIEFIGNYTAFQWLRRDLATHKTSREPTGRSDPELEPPRKVSAPQTSRRGESALRIVIVHPDLLGTYGDTGNGIVLANRAKWRGIDVELRYADSAEPLPGSADIYLLGGGEDGPQVHSADRLADGTLAKAVSAGAVVLAVCAGYQIIGESFPKSDGALHRGIGLLDVATRRGTGPRAVGEIVAEVRPGSWSIDPGELTGFENHAGHTTVGTDATPLAQLVVGVGNGSAQTEGAYAGQVIGTYLHGPVLARNPRLADLLLTLAIGEPLEALDDEAEAVLRRERLAAATTRRRTLRS
jgi:CobQ-like glutamine amidotransferase family enzyme